VLVHRILSGSLKLLGITVLLVTMALTIALTVMPSKEYRRVHRGVGKSLDQPRRTIRVARHPVQKVGHFLAYLVNGCLGFLLFPRSRKWVIAVLVGTIVVVEAIQSAAPGRDPRMTDIVLGLLGLGVALCLVHRPWRRPRVLLEPGQGVMAAPGESGPEGKDGS
jgi:VanZ family protein